MSLKIATLSEIGGRDNNDDTVCFRKRWNNAWVFVGDGLGAYAGGQMASDAASRSFMEDSRKGGMLTDERLREACSNANKSVLELQTKNNGKMKTTCVYLAIENGRARWVHIGDSRLYHFHNGRLLAQTMDHSVSQMAVLMGDIKQSEIRFHEDRNRVLRALGSENAKPELSPVVMLNNGKNAFLLCTDGFWEYVYEDEMENALWTSANPQQWLSKMRELISSRTPENNDNLTAAAVFC